MEIRGSGLRLAGLRGCLVAGVLLVSLLSASVVGYAVRGTPEPLHGTVAETPQESISNAETYPVNFTEQGLPFGSNWSLTLLGHVWNEGNLSLVVFESNGSYAYSGYSSVASPNPFVNGSFTVQGHPVTIALTWQSTEYAGPTEARNSGGGDTVFALAVLLAAGLVITVATLAVVSRKQGPIPPAPRSPNSAGEPRAAPPADPPDDAVAQDPLRHML
ncbi:MAG: hypothetical protein L3J96_00945 [Thermoplasmata archaeon]|nr:hypothetical protein [Thermoplasmata archaeon]